MSQSEFFPPVAKGMTRASAEKEAADIRARIDVLKDMLRNTDRRPESWIQLTRDELDLKEDRLVYLTEVLKKGAL